MKRTLFLAVRLGVITSGLAGVVLVPYLMDFFKGVASAPEKELVGIYFLFIMATIMIGAVRKFEYGKFYTV